MFQGEACSSTSTGEEMKDEMNNDTASDKNFVGGQAKEGEVLYHRIKFPTSLMKHWS